MGGNESHPSTRPDPVPSATRHTGSEGSSIPSRHLAADGFGRAIVETVRVPLLVLEPDSTVVTANPAFHELWATSPDELPGRSIFDVAGGAWNTPELRAGMERVVARDREIRDLQVEVTVPERGVRTLSVDARRIRLEGVGAELILVVSEDVTVQHRYEERIEGYARELERSNRELESFAHAASHDLQEPLRKIRTYAARIVSELDPDALSERVGRYLERLPEAVERMQTRIDDLLRLARLGSEDATREPTDLSEVVATVLDDLETLVAESGARIEVAELPTVDADPSQMRLLFQNLIANGIKFAEEGETPVVRIRAGEDAAPDAGARPPSRQRPRATVVVEDEGIGFEQEYAERIFAPFQRLHGRATYEGSGVGLAICRKIVENHGGTITADGRPGVGARFLLALPRPHERETYS